MVYFLVHFLSNSTLWEGEVLAPSPGDLFPSENSIPISVILLIPFLHIIAVLSIFKLNIILKSRKQRFFEKTN